MNKQFELICPRSAEEWSNCATGRGVVCHMTVLPMQCKANLPNPARFSLFPTLSCGPIGEAVSQHPVNQNGRDCSRSRRRAANGSKRMYLDYTHGLFIT